MQTVTYAPGYSAPILSFMEQRTADTHAGFFLSRLLPGWRVLDAGCGPGSITLGLARKVAPGFVTGIDVEDSQFAKSREQAEREGLNAEFRKASVYQLPFQDNISTQSSPMLCSSTSPIHAPRLRSCGES